MDTRLYTYKSNYLRNNHTLHVFAYPYHIHTRRNLDSELVLIYLPHIAYYASHIHHRNIHSSGTMHPYRPLRPRRNHSPRHSRTHSMETMLNFSFLPRDTPAAPPLKPIGKSQRTDSPLYSPSPPLPEQPSSRTPAVVPTVRTRFCENSSEKIVLCNVERKGYPCHHMISHVRKSYLTKCLGRCKFVSISSLSSC